MIFLKHNYAIIGWARGVIPFKCAFILHNYKTCLELLTLEVEQNNQFFSKS